MFEVRSLHALSVRCTGAVALAAAALLAVPAAQAGVAVGLWTRASSVSDSVDDNNDGTWTYNYVVKNRSFVNASGEDQQPIIVDWELPWFGDAGISLDSILSPRNWAYSIETIGVANAATGWGGVADWQTPGDPFYVAGSVYNTATQVLHWYNLCWAQRQRQDVQIEGGSQAVVAACEFIFDNAIFPSADGDGGELGGFSFVAAYDQVPAPYQASWANLPVQTGDPAFPGGIPNSPAVSRNGTVPEPTPLLLLALAAGIGGLVGRRRQG